MRHPTEANLDVPDVFTGDNTFSMASALQYLLGENRVIMLTQEIHLAILEPRNKL